MTMPICSTYRTRGRRFPKEQLGMTGTGKANTSLIKKVAVHTGLAEKQVVDWIKWQQKIAKKQREADAVAALGSLEVGYH